MRILPDKFPYSGDLEDDILYNNMNPNYQLKLNNVFVLYNGHRHLVAAHLSYDDRCMYIYDQELFINYNSSFKNLKLTN